jgi:hypothetical protein
MTTEKIQINLRIDPGLRDRVQASADAHGVSVTREINERLRESLEAEPPAFAVENPALRGLLQVMVTAMEVTGQQAAFASLGAHGAGGDWLNSPFAYDQAMKAALHVLENFRPEGDITAPTFFRGGPEGGTDLTDLSAAMSNLGRGFANGILFEVASEEPTTTTALKRAPILRGALGPEMVERLRGKGFPK